MAKPLTEVLTAEKALIFRITHRNNIPWILRHGLHCRRSEVHDPDFEPIGNPELIERRSERQVPIPPGGTLDDYVPFYFTPFSPMLYNIKTGYGGIKQRPNTDIVVLVSSLPALRQNGVSYVFTDRHAYLQTANFYADDAKIGTAVDFALLSRRDFSRDAEHPENFDRYQAEALAHRSVPVSALLGIGCYTSDIKTELEAICSHLRLTTKIVVRAEWYF
jgi:hypothetical protein